MDIAGCTALVTGANRGIGAALVEALLRAEASRVYAAVRDVSSVKAKDGRVVAVPLDITRTDDVTNAVQRCADVSLLINNAGVNSNQGIIADGDLDLARQEMEVNYLGLLRMCIAFAPILRANGGGAIVNILTVLARVNLPRSGSYSASKAAAYSATQAIRAELAGQRTLVVGVCPGTVDTEMTLMSPPPKMAPAEVASAVLEAVEAGIEEIYPGTMAASVSEGLDQDRHAVEQRFRSMLPQRQGRAG